MQWSEYKIDLLKQQQEVYHYQIYDEVFDSTRKCLSQIDEYKKDNMLIVIMAKMYGIIDYYDDKLLNDINKMNKLRTAIT